GAAVKPAGNCQTTGTVYGSYIMFHSLNREYYYGNSCFDRSNSTDYSSQTSASLPSDFGFFYFGAGAYLVVIYGFDGSVGVKLQATSAPPIKTYFDTPLVMLGNPPGYIDPQSLRIYQGSNSYYVYFSSTGLVCEQPTSTST